MVGLDHRGDTRARTLDLVGPVVVEMIRPDGDSIVEDGPVRDVLLGQDVVADKPAALALADVPRDRCEDVTVELSASVAVRLKIVDEPHHLPSRVEFGRRKALAR